MRHADVEKRAKTEKAKLDSFARLTNKPQIRN